MFHGKADREVLFHLIARVFRKCSSIAKVELRMDITEHTTEVHVVRNALQDLEVRELALTGQPSFDRFNQPNGIG